MPEDRKTLLWLDNDLGQVEIFRGGLQDDEFEVVIAVRISEGQRLIPTRKWDLLILDVMIPLEEEELEDYTSGGLKTGLMFLRRNASLLRERRIPVMVTTVLRDEGLLEAFRSLGLPKTNYVSKEELETSQDLVDRIRVSMANPLGPEESDTDGADGVTNEPSEPSTPGETNDTKRF